MHIPEKVQRLSLYFSLMETQTQVIIKHKQAHIQKKIFFIIIIIIVVVVVVVIIIKCVHVLTATSSNHRIVA